MRCWSARGREGAGRARAERDAAGDRRACRRAHRAGVKVASISLDGATPATQTASAGSRAISRRRWRRFDGCARAGDGAGEHGRDARYGGGAARDRADRQGDGRVDLGGVLPRPGRAGPDTRRADAGRERGRLPFPGRGLPSRIRRPHGRGAVLPPGGRPAERRPGTAAVGATFGLGPLYEQLAAGLRAELGAPTSSPRAQTKGTRDGRGSCSSRTTERSIRRGSFPSRSATSSRTRSSGSTASTRFCAASEPPSSAAAAGGARTGNCAAGRGPRLRIPGDPLAGTRAAPTNPTSPGKPRWRPCDRGEQSRLSSPHC